MSLMYTYEMGRMLALPHGAAPPGDGRAAAVRPRMDGRTHELCATPIVPSPAAPPWLDTNACEVEVAHVGAKVAGTRDAHHRVHVRAVHVHLAAILVHDGRDLLDARLEHACVDGYVTIARERRRMLLRLRAQVVDVDVAVGIRFHTTTWKPATPRSRVVPCRLRMRHTVRAGPRARGTRGSPAVPQIAREPVGLQRTPRIR